MSQAQYKHWSPLLGRQDADRMMNIAEAFGSFGTYADEATSDGLGENLPKRQVSKPLCNCRSWVKPPVNR